MAVAEQPLETQKEASAPAAAPAVAAKERRRAAWLPKFTQREVLLMVVFFAGKLVSGLSLQIIRVYAPFLAKDERLSFHAYRVGIAATDLAALLPSLFNLDASSPRALASGAMVAMATFLFLPQILPGEAPWPATVSVCRLATGCSWTVYAIVAGAVMSHFPKERRTQAVALVETAWFLASFCVAPFGFLLDRRGATFTIASMLVVPSLLLAWASFPLLPNGPEEYQEIEDPGGGGGSGGGDGTGRSSEPSGRSSGSQSPSSCSLHRRMAGMLVFSATTFFCNSIFMCRYGVWLHNSFGMSAAELGWFSNAIGIGNFAGNLVTQFLGDRLVSVHSLSLFMTVILCAINAVLATASHSIGEGPLFVLTLANCLAFECSFLASLSYTMRLCKGAEMSGMSLRFGYGALGSVIADWLAPYPSMPLLFTISSVGFLVASAALALQAEEAQPDAVAMPDGAEAPLLAAEAKSCQA